MTDLTVEVSAIEKDNRIIPLVPLKNPLLEFSEGQYLLKVPDVSGQVHEHLVSAAAVREAFTGEMIDSGWIAPEVRRWGTGRSGEWAVLFIPPQRHMLEITSERAQAMNGIERITIPLPGMVFFGVAVKYFAWAVKTADLQPHHEVFRCPLPNVEPDAAVCFGLHKQPRASARNIMETWRIFVRPAFNNHRCDGKSKSHPEDIREVLFELASAGDDARYPVDDLVRQMERTGITLDKAIREFFETGEMAG